MKADIIELSADQKPEALCLIKTSGLRSEHVLAKGTRYWGAYQDGRLVGLIGCEFEGTNALLRTAFVLKPCRGQGIAARLTQTLIQTAKESGFTTVYLFSTDAGEYWVKQGFYSIPVSEVVRSMPAAPQVKLFEALGWLSTEAAYRCDL